MRVAALVLTASVLVAAPPSAGAADPEPPSPHVGGSTSQDSIIVEAAQDGIAAGQDAPASSSVSSPEPTGSFSSDADSCDGEVELANGDNPAAVYFCAGLDSEAPVVTVGLIRRAFAELELPAGTLVVQPPDGLTLVNFDTNFYTTSTRPIARTVTLLGQRVTLEAAPSTFHWTFGDGEQLSTSEPGAPYPDLTVTHNYLRKGTYRPSLATTYTGRYRVGGGPWRTIPGTVTIDGPGQPLRAIEARPKLVSY